MRLIVLMLLFTAVLKAQVIGPFLQHESSKSLLKSKYTEYHLTVRGTNTSFDEMEKQGFAVQTRVGNLGTVVVPREKLEDLLQIKGLKKVSLGPKNKLHNSLAVNYQNVDAAYAKGYTGDKVIVGVVDTGIDFYHPMFLKADGKTRILSIWDQTGYGNAPSGYEIGVEYTEAQINQDLASGTPNSYVQQVDVEGHGTHVAGSAAGRDLTVSPTDTLHGGAITSNLIIVKTTLVSADITNGVKYIFDKAKALSKPCVVNLSLGSQYGPHDGTDDDSQLLDGLTGAGKIVVRSAGNSGADSVHYFASNIASSISVEFKYTSLINLWLEAGDDVQSASLTWDGGSITNVTKNTSKSNNDETVTLYLLFSDNNGKFSAIVFMENESLKSKTFTLTLNSVSDANSNGKIGRHAWTETSAISSPYEGFTQGSLYGNNHYPYTISNGACASEVITVGAFITKGSWMSSVGGPYYYPNSGDEGGIAAFSAIGPTATEGNKPDIIAGGTIILSARSANATYSGAFLPPSPYTNNYAYMQGTSMASPVATGAIALLLEKNPTWTPADVLDYLKNNAKGTTRPAGVTQQQLEVKDNPGTWDKVFGYGAVDLTEAFNPNGIEDVEPTFPNQFSLEQNYPNPFNPSTKIKYQVERQENIKLQIYNALGQKVRTLVDHRQEAGTYSVTLDGSNLSSGIYFYKLTVGSDIQVRKMVLMR